MNIPLDEVIYFDAITTTPSTGAAVDADSAPTFAVYEEATDTDIGVGGSMTKRTSLTGNYRGSFTLSAANGFEVGKWYSIIAIGIVGGVTGKAVLKNFRCVAAEAIAGKVKADVDALLGTAWLTPATAGTPDINVKLISGDATAADNAEAFFDGTGYAGTNNVIPTVTAVTGLTAADVGAIKAKTDLLPADPADASDIAASFSTVNGTLATLATASNLATVAGYLDTEMAATLAIANKLDTAMELDGAVYRFTVNALEQAPVGGGGGSTDWTADERTALRTILGIPTSGTTPEVPSAGAIKIIDDLLDTEVAAIKAKTDLIPSDPADASDIAGSFSTVNSTLSTLSGYVDTVEAQIALVKAKTDLIPAAPASTTNITSATGIVLAAATHTGAVIPTVSAVTGLTASDVGAIKAKTDNLPAAPASTTNITAGTITTVTNLTNAPTAGDFTATMKSSITTAVPTAAAISTQVAADLLTAHGSGSWVAVSGFATAVELDKVIKSGEAVTHVRAGKTNVIETITRN